MYLLDSNILSEVMKPKPASRVRVWVLQQNRVALSTVTLEEIYFGLTYKDAYKQLVWFESFVEELAVIRPVTAEIAQYAGTLRARFRQQGITRSQADMLIAATAQHHGLVLATRNTRDFEACGVELFNPFTE